MNKLNIYCLSLYNEGYDKIRSLGYMPVGLGDNNFDARWLKDNIGKNISQKNKFYGEYTFHYWFWKNKLSEISDNEWTGFCTYRRFWTSDENLYEIKKKSDFLENLDSNYKDYDVILGDYTYMGGWSMMKIIKHGLKSFILNPRYLIKKNRNLKLHFDSFHGYGNLDKAINLLDSNDREDFRKFTETQNYYNKGNMFICKSKKIFDAYYNTVFTWLKKCEEIFGFSGVGYSDTRMYGFLIERFCPYWFNKYTKVKILPIAFLDINKTEII